MAQPLAQRLAAGDERIAVTGATGWFGRVTLDLLGRALGPTAFAARVRAHASRPRRVVVAGGVGEVDVRALEALEPADVVAHYAFLTKDLVAVRGVEAFVAANLAISRRVADAVRGGLFYTSSGAAREPDVDTNPYGALKRLDELALPAAAPGACVVARVFNVSGPHMTKPELYALGDLILAARQGRALCIGAQGDVVRSYVAVGDVVAVGLSQVLAGEGAFFETAGERAVEIEELARVVRTSLDRDDLPIERTRDPTAPSNVYVGDGRALRDLAARHGIALATLEEQVAQSVRWLASSLPAGHGSVGGLPSGRRSVP